MEGTRHWPFQSACGLLSFTHRAWRLKISCRKAGAFHQKCGRTFPGFLLCEEEPESQRSTRSAVVTAKREAELHWQITVRSDEDMKVGVREEDQVLKHRVFVKRFLKHFGSWLTYLNRVWMDRCTFVFTCIRIPEECSCLPSLILWVEDQTACWKHLCCAGSTIKPWVLYDTKLRSARGS